MKRPGRRGLRTALLLALLASGAAVAVLRTRWAADQACALARRELPTLLGLDVGIGRCELDPLSLRVRLGGVSVFAKGSDAALFAAEEVEVGLRSLRPLTGAVDLELLRVVHPRVVVDARGGGPGGTGVCPFEVLRRVGVHQLEIHGAELHLVLPGERALDLAGVSLDWTRRRGVSEFNGTVLQGRVRLSAEEELPIARVAVEGGLDADALRLELGRAQVDVDQASVRLTGRVDGLCAPAFALDGQAFLPLQTLAKVLPLPKDASGQLWTRVMVSGTGTAPRLALDLVGTQVALPPYHPGDFKARASVTREEFKLDELTIATGSGTATVDGTLKWGPTWPVRLHLDAEDAQFGSILERAGIPGSWVDFLATGKASLAGHLLPSPHLTGEADLRTSHFVLAPWPFDAAPSSPSGAEILRFAHAHVQTGLRVQADRFEFTEARVQTERSHVAANVALFFDGNRGLDIRGQVDALDLGEFGRISGLAWGGTGSGRFSVEGPYGRVRVDSELALRDFTFWQFALGVVQGKVQYEDGSLLFPSLSGQKGRTVFSGSGSLDFLPESAGGLHAKARVFVSGGRTEDLIDISAGVHPYIPFFRGALVGEADGAVLIDSPVNAFDGVVKLNFHHTQYYGRALGEGEAILRFVHGQSLRLDALRFRGPLGQWSIEGGYDFSGPLDYRFRGDEVSLEECVGPERARRWGLGSRLTLVGKVEGDAQTPVVSAYLTSPGISIAGRDGGDLHLEGRIVGKRLEVWGRPLGGTRGSANLTLQEPYPFEAQLTLAIPEIRPFLPAGAAAQGVSGGLSGTLSAHGTVAGDRTLAAKLELDKLTLARGDFQGTNDGPIQLSYENGWLGVDALTFRAPNTRVTAAGALGPAGLALSVQGSLDVRFLESFAPVLERTGGRIELSAALGGTPEEPTLVGSAEVQDAHFAFRDLPLVFRSVNGRVEFSESRLLFRDFGAALNDGQLRAEGDVRLEHLLPGQLELRLALDDVTFRFLEDLPVKTTGELTLAGPPRNLRLAGDLDVRRFKYDRPIGVDTLVKRMLQPRTSLPSDREADWLTFDVGIHAREGDDVRIDNNLLKAGILGDLQVVGSLVHPGVLGKVRTAEGSQLFFRQNQYVLEQFVAEFNDRTQFDPIFDVHAQTQARDYLVKMHAFGRASDPVIHFSAEPDLPEKDIVSLLANDSISGDKSNTAVAGAGLAFEAAMAASGLDRMVQRYLPNTPFVRVTKFHITTAYNDGSGVVEPVAQLESKLLTDRLTLRATEPVTGKGTKAQAEYRFSDRLSLQIQWDNGESDYSFGNLGAVFMFRGQVK